MRLLITGATGKLGRSLSQIALDEGHEVIAGCHLSIPACGMHAKIDITDSQSIDEIIQIQPEAIIHCAALSDVDTCEKSRARAIKLNIMGTYNVSEAARAAGAHLINISTDYIFDGAEGNYSESDRPNPINFYGATKLLAESLCDTNIRTSCIFDDCPNWITQRLDGGYEILGVSDQFTTPTFADNLSEMVLEVAERGLHGTYNLAGTSRVSRFEFLNRYADALDYDPDLIQPAKMADMEWSATRPADSSLNCSKAIIALKTMPLSLDEVFYDR